MVGPAKFINKETNGFWDSDELEETNLMPSIISPSQSGFLEGRQILDPILIANEAVEIYRIRKRKDGSLN